MTRLALAASLAAGVLTAQEPPPRPAITGAVTNSLNGEPIRKATVTLSAQDEAKGMDYTAESDGNGRFVIADVEPGDYSISAERQSFMREVDGAPGAPPPSLKVEAGQSIHDVKIKLVPLGIIAGRVLDDDGDPVRGARVEANAYTYVTGKKELGIVEQVLANDKGEFRLFGLRPGTLYLRAFGPKLRLDATFISRAGIPSSATYFPSAISVAQAAPIQVSAGVQLSGFDIRLRSEMRFSVRGKLPVQLQKPDFQGYNLMLVLRGNLRQGGSSSIPLFMHDETFEFTQVPPGSYIVVCTVPDGGKTVYAQQAVEVINADVEGITLNFSPLTEVSGSVAPPRPLENLQVMLHSENPMFGQAGAEVKTDGSFVIKDVAPDVYEVTLGPHPRTYVKSIRFGDEEVLDGRIDLTKASGPLTILLGADVGDVEGTVKRANGDPAVRAHVTLIGRIDLSQSGFTDEQGKFHLRGVAPG